MSTTSSESDGQHVEAQLAALDNGQAQPPVVVPQTTIAGRANQRRQAALAAPPVLSTEEWDDRVEYQKMHALYAGDCAAGETVDRHEVRRAVNDKKSQFDARQTAIKNTMAMIAADDRRADERMAREEDEKAKAKEDEGHGFTGKPMIESKFIVGELYMPYFVEKNGGFYDPANVGRLTVAEHTDKMVEKFRSRFVAIFEKAASCLFHAYVEKTEGRILHHAGHAYTMMRYGCSIMRVYLSAWGDEAARNAVRTEGDTWYESMATLYLAIVKSDNTSNCSNVYTKIAYNYGPKKEVMKAFPTKAAGMANHLNTVFARAVDEHTRDGRIAKTAVAVQGSKKHHSKRSRDEADEDDEPKAGGRMGNP